MKQLHAITTALAAALALAGALAGTQPAAAQGSVAPGRAAPGSAAQGGAAQGGAAPQVIRPSATIGPGLPGQPATAGQSGAVPPSAGGGAAPAAGSLPRFPGMARFQSVAKNDAVMFDAPSERAKKLFVAPEGMPVEVVSVLRTWVKVRDPLGDFTWVNRDDLSDRRTLVAMAVAPLRREPQATAPAWFNVDRGVVLDLLEERVVNGFVKVRYVEGQVGYIQPGQVWGL
ncbi:MAG: SH3 domain-containing protein [Lautropia sp.]